MTVMKIKAKKTRKVRRKVKIKKVIMIKIMKKMVHQRLPMKVIKSLYHSNPQT